MEGGIEYNSVELLVLERHARELGLKPWEHCRQLLAKMFRCSKTVVIVDEQVHGNGAKLGERQPVAHPAVSGAQIQYQATFTLEIPNQHVLDQIVVAARPDLPLFGISSGEILIRKTKIEIILLASSAFSGPYAFVVRNETRIIRASFWRQGIDNPMIDSHSEPTELTFQPVDVSSATWALRAN